MTQLSKQLSEHLVAAELARRGIVATPFSGNVPDIDILAFKSGKSILANGNEELVERLALLSEKFDRPVATPLEARKILGLG